MHACISMLIAHAPREAGFRFDVSVLDESRLVLALGYHVRLGQRFLHIAANHPPAHQNIPFAMRMNPRRIRRQRLVDRLERRQLFPTHGKLRQIERFQRVRLAHHRRNCFPAESRLVVRKYRLIRISWE